MNYPINKLSSRSRKRVTRRILQQLRYLRCWYSDALCEANAAEFDGDVISMLQWEQQAQAYALELRELEGRLA
jgi:hypothetical protein